LITSSYDNMEVYLPIRMWVCCRICKGESSRVGELLKYFWFMAGRRSKLLWGWWVGVVSPIPPPTAPPF